MKKVCAFLLVLSFLIFYVYAEETTLTDGKKITYSQILSVDKDGISFMTKTGITHANWLLVPPEMRKNYMETHGQDILNAQEAKMKKKVKQEKLRIEKEKNRQNSRKIRTKTSSFIKVTGMLMILNSLLI